MGQHENLNMPGVIDPRGYSDATLTAPGRLLYLAGHVAFDEQRHILHPGQLVPQIEQSLKNLCATLARAGGTPEHLVKINAYTLDMGAWRAAPGEIGRIWRSTLGRVYPAMSLLGVRELYDEGALVEIEAVAVLPLA